MRYNLLYYVKTYMKSGEWLSVATISYIVAIKKEIKERNMIMHMHAMTMAVICGELGSFGSK